MGRPTFNTRPGRPGQYGPGNPMYDRWASQRKTKKGVRYKPSFSGQGELDTEFYKDSQFFDEYKKANKKANKTKNFKSKKDARSMNKWVQENKGVDMYNTTGSTAEEGGKEEKDESWNVNEYNTVIEPWEPVELDVSTSTRELKNIEAEVNKIEKEKLKLDGRIDDISSLKIPKINPISNVKSAFKGTFNQLKVRNKQTKAKANRRAKRTGTGAGGNTRSTATNKKGGTVKTRTTAGGKGANTKKRQELKVKKTASRKSSNTKKLAALKSKSRDVRKTTTTNPRQKRAAKKRQELKVKKAKK